MIDGYNIVLCIPAGRRRYMEVLIPQLLRETGWDELQVWVNTNDADDISYLNGLPALDQRIRLLQLPAGVAANGGWTIHHFYPHCIDEDTVYIRLDDDVCWIEPGTIAKLAAVRIRNQMPFLIYPIIVNNAIVTHIWQALGKISANNYIHAQCMDNIGWKNPKFAENLHRMFLGALAQNNIDHFKFPTRAIALSRMSINCIAWLGREFAKFSGRLGSNDEEEWLSVTRPTQLGVHNLIYGDSIVAHFSFYTQRDHLDTTDILSRYKELAGV